MRIAMITGHAVPYQRASDPAPADDQHAQGLRVTALARALAGLGHQVTIYARRDASARPRAAAQAGVRIEHLTAGPAVPLDEHQLLTELGRFSHELVRRWRQSKPEIVHAHFWTSGLAALAAARELPVPVVQTFHSLAATGATQPEGEPDGTRNRLESVIARSVSAVLAGSDLEASALARLGVPRAAVTVVPAGVDIRRFGPDGPVARHGKRARLLAIGPASGEPGLAVVVQALATVPDAELVVLSGAQRADPADDPALRDLPSLAERLGVGDRLELGGQASAARLPALLRSAELLVHVATDQQSEPVPLQAMACGTPVVATADAVNCDAVVDGATGALVPAGDPAALARRIRQLLASPMQLQGFGIAAANRVRTRYSWERVGTETVAVYERAAQIGCRR
jgi:glycosyltransferase involved in cell wall biosynthesis